MVAAGLAAWDRVRTAERQPLPHPSGAPSLGPMPSTTRPTPDPRITEQVERQIDLDKIGTFAKSHAFLDEAADRESVTPTPGDYVTFVPRG
jgi:hypothetical protein